MDHNIQTELDGDGVLLASIDMPGRSMNVFSLDMMDSLERLLMHVETQDDIQAVVLTSGKAAFLAGADLDMIRMFTERAQIDTHAQLVELCGRLSRLFRRLEKSRKPYVAAINGLALGGGLELSLACHGRVVADEAKLQLGLPEVKLGLLPGAGGTQRLPRLAGTKLGLRMLLDGNPLSPVQAIETGVVDEVVKPGELIAAAKRRACSLVGATSKPWDTIGKIRKRFNSAPFDFARADAPRQIAIMFGIGDDRLRRYPAYHAIMDCVVGGWNKPMDEACDWEVDCFVRLIQDPVAGNMVRTLFLNRQRAAKIAPSILSESDLRIAVIGHDGVAIKDLLDTARAPLATSDEVAETDTVLLVSAPQAERGIRLKWLNGGVPTVGGGDIDGCVWLSEPTPHGRVLEVSVPAAGVLPIDAGIILSRWLRSSVLITEGRRALLPTLQATQAAARRLHCLESDELLAIALAAARVWSEGGVPDTELADVAVVVAGLHPAYTGGPYRYLRGCDAAVLRTRIAEAEKRMPGLFHLPARLDELLREYKGTNEKSPTMIE